MDTLASDVFMFCADSSHGKSFQHVPVRKAPIRVKRRSPLSTERAFGADSAPS